MSIAFSTQKYNKDLEIKYGYLQRMGIHKEDYNEAELANLDDIKEQIKICVTKLHKTLINTENEIVHGKINQIKINNLQVQYFRYVISPKLNLAYFWYNNGCIELRH
jgi:hypothetical protein